MEGNNPLILRWKGIHLTMGFETFAVYVQSALFLLMPLILPLALKKWIWFGIVGAGYIFYIGLGVLLFTGGDFTEGGAFYGVFLPFFLGMTSITGLVVQLIADWFRKKKRRKDKNA